MHCFSAIHIHDIVDSNISVTLLTFQISFVIRKELVEREFDK